MLKKITALISAVIIAAAAAVPAMAYDVVNLPARMTMAEERNSFERKGWNVYFSYGKRDTGFL